MEGSPNWTGFQSDTTGIEYTAAFSYWDIPSSFSTPPGETDVAQWAGIGSGNSASQGLLQAGTDTRVSPSDVTNSYAWLEFYPAEAQQIISSLSVVAGSNDYASVAFNGTGSGSGSYGTPSGSSGELYNVGDIDRYYYYVAKTQSATYCNIAPWAATTGSIYSDSDFPIDWAGYGYPIVASTCGL